MSLEPRHQQTSSEHENRLHSPSAISNLVFNESTKQWFTAALMAMSIIINVCLAVALSHSYAQLQQTEDLKRYDLDFFKQNDWADLKTKVATQEKLIEAYGLQKAVVDAAREK